MSHRKCIDKCQCRDSGHGESSFCTSCIAMTLQHWCVRNNWKNKGFLIENYGRKYLKFG